MNRAALSVISTSPVDRDRGEFDRSSMQHSITYLSVTVAVSIAVTACGAIPVGYDKVEDSTRYVTPETLAAIEVQHLVRDEVIEILGTPDADNTEHRALGFERCTEPSGKELQILFPLVWPFSGAEYENRHCQKIGIWFDEAGRAFRIASKSYVEGTESCSLGHWLHRPGGSCW